MKTPARFIVAVALLVGPGRALAQAPSPPGGAAGGKGPIVLTVENSRRDLVKIAVPRLRGDAEAAHTVTEIVGGDLSVSGWFNVLDPRAFLANLPVEDLGIVVGDWRNVGAQAVSKGKVTESGGQVSMEFRLYELGRGDTPVLNRAYHGPAAQLRAMAHGWSNEVVRYFASEDGFFSTQIAFSAPSGAGRKDIYVMDYDGANLRKLTDDGSQNILPAWSPSGDRVAFTSFLRGNPDLYTVAIGGGRPRKVSDRPGVNMGAAFSPDGSKIACTLSQDGNSEIYALGTDGSILRRLTNATAFIDTSPAWSPDGTELAFVSNRHGSPQIWMMDATGGNPRRVTMVGTYNQEPAFCPRCATPTLAFTARDERAAFDVFTIDLKTRQLTRVTENQGNNEHPSWAPNGRALAVASSRGGIWVITADGKQQRQVYKGPASTPTWGPARKSTF